MKPKRFTFLRKRKWWLKTAMIGFTVVFAFLLLANYRVEVVSAPYIKSDLKELPDVKVGVVPGTIKYLKSGSVNQYFQHRIDAAANLYNSGKVKYLLISGDNGSKDYNEPLDMRNSLMEKGIPESAIILDYAGFDTYDSMIRARKVFGQKRFIVISQEFQNERAVYIARRFGIEAYGYNANMVTYAGGFKTKIREFFARGKAYIEVNMGVEPTYLGEKIEIE